MAARLRLWWIPALFVIAMAGQRAWIGPFWQHPSFDPDYPYLFNALRLARVTMPFHIDHPGTPVQALGAVVLRVAGLFGGDPTELVTHHAETLLGVLALSLDVCIAGALGLWGLTVHRVSGSWNLALAGQALPLLIPRIFVDHLNRFDPEPALMAVALLQATLIVRMAQTEPVRRHGMLLGALCGLGIAIKINAAPVAAALILALPSLPLIATATLCAGAAFIVSTLPLIPAYPRLFAWAYALAAHEGTYGTGQKGWIAPGLFMPGLRSFIAGAPVLLLSLVAGIVVLWMGRRLRLKQPLRRWLIASLVGIVLQALAMVKQPELRYLTPAFALPALTLVLGVLILRQMPEESARWIRGVAIVCGAALLPWFSTSTVMALQQRRTQFQESEKIVRVRQAEGDCLVASYYPASTPEFALDFGNLYAGESSTAAMADRFSRYARFDLATGTIHTMGHSWTAAEAAQQLPCVLIQGGSGVQPPTPLPHVEAPARLRDLYRGTWQRLWRLETLPPAPAR